MRTGVQSACSCRWSTNVSLLPCIRILVGRACQGLTAQPLLVSCSRVGEALAPRELFLLVQMLLRVPGLPGPPPPLPLPTQGHRGGAAAFRQIGVEVLICPLKSALKLSFAFGLTKPNWDVGYR